MILCFKKMHIMEFILAAGVFFSVSACAGNSAKPESAGNNDYSRAIQYLDKSIRENMKKNGISALGVAIVVDGNTVFIKNYGVMNKLSKTPVPEDAYFQPGSISKSFTALAVMKLAEEGRIDIDAPVTKYLPEFAMKSRFPGAKDITIRHLLSHRAGLPRDYYAGWDADSYSSSSKILARL